MGLQPGRSVRVFCTARAEWDDRALPSLRWENAKTTKCLMLWDYRIGVGLDLIIGASCQIIVIVNSPSGLRGGVTGLWYFSLAKLVQGSELKLLLGISGAWRPDCKKA